MVVRPSQVPRIYFFASYNVMMIERQGGKEGVPERIGLGVIHVTAFSSKTTLGRYYSRLDATIEGIELRSRRSTLNPATE